MLVLPAAVMAGDSYRATNTMIPNLTAASTKAQAHVTDNNRGVLQPLITDLNTQIATAISANNGLAATVLAFTPPQWNADHDLLTITKGRGQTSDTALQKDRSDVHDIWRVRRGSTSSADSASSPAAS